MNLSDPIINSRPALGCQKGMTLIELLVVITILASVAWMATGTVANNNEQIRFEDTRNRLQMIRRAIIGDTSRTINGGPEIRGYVADMGNLPPNLNALIRKDYCSDPQYIKETDCTSNSGTWTVQGGQCSDYLEMNELACTTAGETWTTNYSFISTLNLWTGWNGPYLQAAEITSYPRFLDGWSNDDGSNNFGWTVTTGVTMDVQSNGKDNVYDPSGSDYEADYPPNASKTLIADNQYRVLITDSSGVGEIKIDFGTPTIVVPGSPPTFGSPASLCAKIAYRVNGTITEFLSKETYPPTTTPPTAVVWDGTQKTANFTFGINTYFPLGQMVYGIFTHDGTDCTNNFYPPPPPPASYTWKSFTVVPGATLPKLSWIIL